MPLCGYAPRKHSRPVPCRSRCSLFAHSLAFASSATGGARLSPSRRRSCPNLLVFTNRKSHPIGWLFLLAEMERFELSRRLTRPTPLAGAPLRPLEYISMHCVSDRLQNSRSILYYITAHLSSAFLKSLEKLRTKSKRRGSVVTAPPPTGGFLIYAGRSMADRETLPPAAPFPA